MNKNKKAMSVIVATTLLIMMAVVVGVGFQVWYTQYSSKLLTNNEVKGNTFINKITIEKLVGDTLYVRNPSGNNLSINNIKIKGVNCDITNNNYNGEIIKIKLSEECIDAIGNDVVPEVVLESGDLLLSKRVDYIYAPIYNGPIYTDTFISVWNTSEPGTSNASQVALPLEALGTYNFVVTGATLIGSPVTITSHTQNVLNFTSQGIQEISITGTIIGWNFGNTQDELKLYEIKAWGPLALIDGDGWGAYFYGCENFDFTGSDSLNVSGTTDLSNMFDSCYKFNGNINSWDVSSITSMAYMFCDANSFNQPLNNWDVSSVTDMSGLFDDANNFNQPLNNWDVSSVTNMNNIFEMTASFNQPLNNWDVSSVTNMGGMFGGTSFNQDINNWNTSKVTNMHAMFWGTNFNQPLNNWDVSKVTNMNNMFDSAISFNQPLDNWNVSNVLLMYYTFHNATSFNQDISSWNTSKVTNVYSMFSGATSFNQDLSSWDLDQITLVSRCDNFNLDTTVWSLPKPSLPASCLP